MPRTLRFVPTPGTLVEVTTRTVQGRLLLQPTSAVNDAVVGVLGRAQRIYGMVVHFAAVLSNHYHLLLAPTSARQLADFMGFVNSNIAREVGRLVDWKEKFWGRRYQAIVVSDEVQAQLRRLEYFLAQGVKESLVESPVEWPGVHSARALLEGRRLVGTWFNRTACYRARQRQKIGDAPIRDNDYKTEERLELSPLPCLASLEEAQYRNHLENLIEKVVSSAAALRKSVGSMVMGPSRLRKQHPHTRPNRIKESPAPRFHTYSLAAQRALRAGYADFAAAFRKAAEKLRGGDWTALFPPGCFPPALPFCH